MIDAVVALAPTPGLTASACVALKVSRASVYRQRAHLARPPVVRQPRPKPPRALTAVERQTVLDLLRAPRFADQAPAEIYACLLDQGVYHCSIRTMYRILVQSQEVRERRNQLRHPIYKKPELLAQAPNEVWSWDITKLMGPRQMVLLLPLRHHRYFQPARRRLVYRRQGKRHSVRGVVRGRHQQKSRAERPTHPARRPRRSDARQGHSTAARRARRHQIPQPAPHLQ
jgi:hypothetical protein